MKQTFFIDKNLYLLNHPFYQAWMEGRLSMETLQDYARQYYQHVEAFPSYLQNAIKHCSDETTQATLEENLSEEDGSAHGISHPDLWLQFAEGLGVPQDEVKNAKLRSGIKKVVNTFTISSRDSLPDALGSLYAYESQVPEIANSKIEGLKKYYGIQDNRTLAFFEVHMGADIQHRESLLRLIENLPQEQKKRAQVAANEASSVLWDFLSDIYKVNGYV